MSSEKGPTDQGVFHETYNLNQVLEMIREIKQSLIHLKIEGLKSKEVAKIRTYFIKIIEVLFEIDNIRKADPRKISNLGYRIRLNDTEAIMTALIEENAMSRDIKNNLLQNRFGKIKPKGAVFLKYEGEREIVSTIYLIVVNEEVFIKSAGKDIEYQLSFSNNTFSYEPQVQIVTRKSLSESSQNHATQIMYNSFLNDLQKVIEYIEHQVLNLITN